jgi:predicted TIM-barrel fold metal-dependent hydrolase
MVERLDELGVDTLLLPTGDVGRHGTLDPFDFEHIAARWTELESLVGRWPGRFAALALLDPDRGMAGVRELRARLAEPWVVGVYLHTHSFDRRLDHADLYPLYAAATDFDLPVAMQAGTSGGLMPSECGRPITIDRAALYFRDTRFVLSHLGWPWVDEAIAMALKFPNVYLGTAAYPPSHWPPAVLRFMRGPGRAKVVFGTNFPTVGHRHALGQLGELDLAPEVAAALRHGTARRVFTRLCEGGTP